MKYFAILIAFLFLFIPPASLANGDHAPDDMHAPEDNIIKVSPAVLIIGLIGAAGIGGVVWYFMKKGKVSKLPQTQKDTAGPPKNTP